MTHERISNFGGLHRVPTPTPATLQTVPDADLWTQLQVADDLRTEAVEDGNDDLARNFEVLMERITDELERRGIL